MTTGIYYLISILDSVYIFSCMFAIMSVMAAGAMVCDLGKKDFKLPKSIKIWFFISMLLIAVNPGTKKAKDLYDHYRAEKNVADILVLPPNIIESDEERTKRYK